METTDNGDDEVAWTSIRVNTDKRNSDDDDDSDDFYFCDTSSSSQHRLLPHPSATRSDAASVNSDHQWLESLRRQVAADASTTETHNNHEAFGDDDDDDGISLPLSAASKLSGVKTFAAVLPDHESLLNLKQGIAAYGKRRYCYYFWYACCAALWCTKDTETPHGAARHYRDIAAAMVSSDSDDRVDHRKKRRRRVLCCAGHCYTPPHRSHDAWQIKSHAYTFVSILWSILCTLFYYALVMHHPWLVRDDIHILLRNITLASLLIVVLLVWVALCANAWWKSCRCRRHRHLAMEEEEEGGEYYDGRIESYGDNWMLHDDDVENDDDDDRIVVRPNDPLLNKKTLVQQSFTDGHFRPLATEANVGKPSLIADDDVSLVNQTLLKMSSLSSLTHAATAEEENAIASSASEQVSPLLREGDGYAFHRIEPSSASAQQWSTLMYRDRIRRRLLQRRMARADRAPVWCCCVNPGAHRQQYDDDSIV